MKSVRVTVSLKNNILISKRESLCLTQIQMAKFCEVPFFIYASFENLKRHPNNSEEDYEQAEKICRVLEIEMDEAFPESLTKIKLNKITREMDIGDFQLEYANQHKQIEQRQLSREINKIFTSKPPKQRVSINTRTYERHCHSLTLRERQVIVWRFGLHGEEEHTFQEIADKLKVEKETIRQIEAHALRKLRMKNHENSSSTLKDFHE